MTVLLKKFQQAHVDSICGIINNTATKILEAPESRAKISAAQGCILLEAPTGSGKTLTIGAALLRMRAGVPLESIDRHRIIWFWFAPFSDLVDQTIASLRAETDLTIRDPRDDREFTTTQDGDVFVSTWQSVSSTTRSLKMRSDTETMPSLDNMIGALRDEGYFIGAVIDEAHHSFNKGPQARSFYIDVVRPDFTIMATATPNDSDLAMFQRLAGIPRLNRLSVSRQSVVDADLNKRGVKAFYFSASARDEVLLDYDEIAIFSGVERHNEIKEALKDEAIPLVPLLLVQVENQQESVDRARATLMKAGMRAEAIGIHTAAEPDKNLRALAVDESKEALIFKMAVATGFDAPRSWTLVSLRSTRSASFGLQVIGRIMRVHKRLQGIKVANSKLLDFGHVFLSDAAAQSGLRGAAEQIKAIVTEVQTVTDDVSVVEVNSDRFVLTDPAGGFTEILFPKTEAVSGKSDKTEAASPPATADFVGALFEMIDQAEAAEEQKQKANNGTSSKNEFEYQLRSDLTYPLRLLRESKPTDISGLEEAIAQRIRIDEAVISLILRPKGTVKMTEEDLFDGATRNVDKKFAFSPERAEAAAQMTLRFNDSLDPRELKAALVRRLRQELTKGGYDDQTDEVLRRTIDIALYLDASLLTDACKECLRLRVESNLADTIPGFLSSKSPLDDASKSIYPVFPPGMNKPETGFAHVLDEDKTGTVVWWLRNVHNARWACRIVRPSGQYYYPDFVVAIAGRKKADAIALAEVKERIDSDDSIEKTRVEHKDYGSVLMVKWDDEKTQWYVVDYNPAIDRNALTKRFEIRDFDFL